ncbi:hypothetical protein N802_18030 [Knoellia sinensis KCTC 19936]|uniref:AB hydrolase-1 domain-containing protein n=1 Tax=Knoellia sinensis KCTC 19936 TaxID=1385520 RepID=A0A0A0J878_9MICO|nr:alpha/beta hydrolase [Knoellia sinensis]KGN32262.1 hypothetical protein N802_18030 [Knoellia sinensis KCTC 19936]
MDTTTLPSIVLVPGHWLSAWAWADVEARLTDLGFTVDAVSLPGTSPGDGDGEDTTLDDQIDALSDAVARQPTPPVLVAHSGAGRVATGVSDRAPESVRRVVYVDSGPAADGSAFDESAGDTPGELPEFADLEAGGASLEGISPAALEEFRTRAVPVPPGVLMGVLELTNEARLDVPSTIIASSIPSEAMMGLAQQGHPMFAEVARFRDLGLVDLPTGHWPMWSRPQDLADAIAAAAQG